LFVSFLHTAKGEHAARKVGSPSPPPAPSRRNRTSFSGIWVQHGQVADLVDQDFVLGGDIDADWGELEVGDGIWDWSAYDKVVTQAAEAGFFVETALQVGPASPTWMYDRKGGNKSVTKVKIIPAEGHHNQPAYFPYYLDPTYQELFLRALDTFAEHLFTLPEAVRARVVAVQAEYGSTGDDCRGMARRPTRSTTSATSSGTISPCPRRRGCATSTRGARCTCCGTPTARG